MSGHKVVSWFTVHAMYQPGTSSTAEMSSKEVRQRQLRFKTMMSAGVLLCLCPNEITAMTTAFEMKPMMICSDVRITRAYFSVGTGINDLLVLLILTNG